MRGPTKKITAVNVKLENVTIGSYHDYFEYNCDLATGKETLKLDGKEVNPDDYRENLNLIVPEWIREELGITNLNKGNL